jgi:hypothetical protein
MTPEEIVKHFGKDALDSLYECVLSHPVHELANWIFSMQTPEDMGRWVMQLREDEANE